MLWFFLFLFGLAIGSFVNVLAVRYDGAHFVFDPAVIGGRSRCPHCRHTLRWFELVPLVSFVVQGGRCRSCGVRISAQYPLVELLSALIFVFVPWYFASYPWAMPAGAYGIPGLWILAFELLLLTTLIDLRLYIIPDEITIFLGVVAVCETALAAAYLEPDRWSFLGAHAVYFGGAPYGNLWVGHLIGALAGVAFFGALALVTRGKGMGMGDVKLALPLGFLFGWPDFLFLCAAAFVIGGIVGAILLVGKMKNMKSAVPFGPFLAFGAVYTFFFAAPLIDWYFRIIGL